MAPPAHGIGKLANNFFYAAAHSYPPIRKMSYHDLHELHIPFLLSVS